MLTMPEAVAQANVELENQPRTFQGPYGQYEYLTGQVKLRTPVFALGWRPLADPATTAQVTAPTLSAVADGEPLAAGSPAIAVADAANGLFTLSPAPLKSLLAAYQYLRFTDAQVQQFVQDAMLRFEAYGDITELIDQLQPALWHYVKGLGYGVLASRYAEQVNVAFQQRREDRAAMSDRFQKLSDREFKLGDTYRDQYYERAGQRAAPAATLATYTYQINPVRR